MRIQFRDGASLKKFFNEAKVYGEFKRWTKLRTSFNLSKSSFEFYKSGLRTIPFKLFDKLMDLFPQKIKNKFAPEIKFLDDDWGRKLGGKKTYSLYKKIFDEGRKKAWKRVVRSDEEEFQYLFHIPLNEELCEFLGAFIGDGFTNKYGHSYFIQFAGHSKLDYPYYKNRIIPIFNKIFPNRRPYIRIKDNSLWVTFHSKGLFTLLTKRFKFPAGIKAYSVVVPQEVLDSKNELFISSLIRGLFDTDGCIGFDRRKSYKKPYPRVNFTSVSSKLMEQVYFLLNKLDLNPTITKSISAVQIQINGIKNAKKFFQKIGTSNQKHIERIKALYPEFII